MSTISDAIPAFNKMALSSDNSPQLGGDLDGQTFDVTTSGDVEAGIFKVGDWEIKLDGSHLAFYYNSTKMARINTNGDIEGTADLVAEAF